MQTAVMWVIWFASVGLRKPLFKSWLDGTGTLRHLPQKHRKHPSLVSRQNSFMLPSCYQKPPKLTNKSSDCIYLCVCVMDTSVYISDMHILIRTHAHLHMQFNVWVYIHVCVHAQCDIHICIRILHIYTRMAYTHRRASMHIWIWNKPM